MDCFYIYVTVRYMNCSPAAPKFLDFLKRNEVAISRLSYCFSRLSYSIGTDLPNLTGAEKRNGFLLPGVTPRSTHDPLQELSLSCKHPTVRSHNFGGKPTPNPSTSININQNPWKSTIFSPIFACQLTSITESLHFLPFHNGPSLSPSSHALIAELKL